MLNSSMFLFELILSVLLVKTQASLSKHMLTNSGEKPKPHECPDSRVQKYLWSCWSSNKAHVHPRWREALQVHNVWQIIQSKWKSEQTFAHSYWRVATHLCTMQQNLQGIWKTEDSHAHPQCREATHVHSVKSQFGKLEI